MRARLYATALAAVFAVGVLLLPAAPAQARSGGNENMWRYLTYGMGGLTAYGAVKKRPTLALIGAAGTYLSYTQWKKAVRRRHERQYRSRVRGYRSSYHHYRSRPGRRTVYRRPAPRTRTVSTTRTYRVYR